MNEICAWCDAAGEENPAGEDCFDGFGEPICEACRDHAYEAQYRL